MTRITKLMIDEIASNAAEKSGVNTQLKTEQIDRYEWAERVRIFAMGGDAAAARANKTLDKIKTLRTELPSGVDYGGRVGRRTTYITVNLAGVTVRAEFGEEKIAPHAVTVLSENELVQAFYDLEGRKSELEGRKSKLQQQVRATVSQFTTLKKLIDAWPEVVELLPAAEQQQKSQLPAIPVAMLNALVGLPTEAAPAPIE